MTTHAKDDHKYLSRKRTPAIAPVPNIGGAFSVTHLAKLPYPPPN